jgi:glycosyltransferase involved in cell wall biosynthesis
MENILVSIIIPVYNMEKYIRKCILSLLEQTHRNIEIILVDDGSSDESPQIINELSRKDSRIIVINGGHQGVSGARNQGLSIAKGEYILFVDSDDWVEPDYVSYFLNLVLKNNCSVGMGKSYYSINSSASQDNEYVISAEKAIEWIYSGDIFVAVWNKIYKNSVLKEHGIKFNKDIWYGEGMLFNIEYLQYVDKVAIGEKSVYHQTYNPDSAMRAFNLESNHCGIRSLELQKQLWKKTNKDIEAAWLYHRYCFNASIINGLVRSDQVRENIEEYKRCIRNIRSNIHIPLKYAKSLKTKVYWICMFIYPSVMAKRAAKKHYKSIKQD